MKYIDHFGEQSLDYLQYRPTYPNEMYEFLVRLVKHTDLAWDCGTGNGQAAVKLGEYFNEVIGSDISQAQLDAAIKKNNVRYYCWPAEKTAIPNASVDLITIAQALHWFNFENFYHEVRRVAKFDGIIAAWCYSLGKINPKMDAIVEKLYGQILGDVYWTLERRYVDEAYRTIPFPFKKIQHPNFTMEKKINFTHFIGYLNTWSAVKEYQKRNRQNPIDLIYSDLQAAWGDPVLEYIARWPIHLLVGKMK